MKEIMIAEKLNDMDKEDIIKVFKEWCIEHSDACDELIEKLEDVI